MDLAKLKDLVDFMNRHQLDELSVEEAGFKASLRRGGTRARDAAGTAPPAGASAAAAAPATAPAAATDDPHLIPSPMVGTFYRASSPDADPYMEVGDRFEEGQVLCIVEAMKVMNEIKAERSGTIAEILVQNGQAVEYGQPLFRYS